jgi:serine/threonine protein kinase
MMEEWVARRVDSPHVLRPCLRSRKSSYLYAVMEYVEGQTLTQWMIDNPKPGLETVRGIIEQIAKGLRAFHRMEMLHQDVRPDNIMIDKTGTVKIIDFGSTRVLGVVEASPPTEHDDILGTEQYTAPEYFLGEGGSPRSDLFSLGVITYQMLTGRLPYGTRSAQARTKSQQRKLKYRSAIEDSREIPVWINGALKRAVHPDPAKRYEELSEFVFDLRRPNPLYLDAAPAPLLERHPLLFWQCLSAILALLVLALLVHQHFAR